jgi:hypothetical protein
VKNFYRLIFATLPTRPGLPLEGQSSGLIENLHRARTPRTVNREGQAGTSAERAEGDGFVWPLAVDKERNPA